MDNEMKIREEFYNKLESEYDSFIEQLKGERPEIILERSYEKVMKEELKDMFYPEGSNYDIADIKVLSKSKAPLQELYDGWMDFDSGIHQQLEFSVEETIEYLRKEQQKEKNKNKER